MTTSPQPMVVAAFTDGGSAEQAITELRNAGFENDQIRYWMGASSGGILEKVKSAFSGQAGTSSHVYTDLTGMGVPDSDATFFQREVDADHTIVAVMAADRQQEATALLARYNGYGANAASTRQATDSSSEAGQKVQLREEQLSANKQSVETGAVGIRKEVVTEQQSVDVPVSREEVVIERHPASGQPSDTPIGEGGTYRVPVREEQVTVDKQPVVREEVSLGKRQVQDSQRVSDTVQREEARVEREGDVPIQNSQTGGEDLSENR